MRRCRSCIGGLFGICRMDYCAAEREGLMREAQQIAEGRGHALAGFIQVKGYPVWQAQCVRCGQLAAICLDPDPNEPDIYGDAITHDCLGYA